MQNRLQRKLPRPKNKDLVVVEDFMMRLRIGKRIHLCEFEADSLADDLNGFFNHEIEIPRIKQGNKQTLNSLINEEAFLLARFLRNEKREWIPRIPSINA
jgi:hypothetical protein